MKKSNRQFLVLGAAMGVLLTVASLARAENERVTRPTSVGLELFGRGLLYTVQVEQVLSEDLAAGRRNMF